MNYTQTKKTNRKPKLIGALLIVLLVLVGGAYLYHNVQSSDDVSTTKNGIDYSPAKPSDNAANEQRKNSGDVSKSETGDNQTLNSTSPSSTASVKITGANTDQSTGILYVGSLVNGETTGNCSLVFSQTGQQSITLTNSVTLQNNSYVCPTFSEPTSKFTNSGQWLATLTVTNGTSIVSDKTSVTIK